MMSNNGSFKDAQQDLYNKAMKTLMSIRQIIKSQLNNSLSVSLKLFYAIIVPILTYGSEIWSAYNNSNSLSKLFNNDKLPMEKLQNRFCKHILGVQKTTSSLATRAQLGKYPLCIQTTNACRYEILPEITTLFPKY